MIRPLLCCLFAALPLCRLAAQCPGLEGDTLYIMHFEAGAPGWELPPSAEGGAWQVGNGSIGPYRNPGSGAWLYVREDQDNRAATASARSPALAADGYSAFLELSFDVLFQAYDSIGRLRLDLWTGQDWEAVWEESEDFTGRIELEIGDYAGPDLRLRFVFDDEGGWGWGAGIDNLLLRGRKRPCGDGLCAPGERSDRCPADCPPPQAPAPGWVPLGEDIAGKPVAHHYFKGNTPCDDCSEKISLPFAFQLYGNEYRQLWINANGNLSFGSEYLEYTPDPFCLGGPMMVAPFFADADLMRGGEIRYYLDPEGHYLLVTWLEVGYFGCEGPCGLRNSFQVLLSDGSLRSVRGQRLPPGANILFSYGQMQWTTGNSSGGEGGFGGSAATVGVNLGDGVLCSDYGAFDRGGDAYFGTSEQACPPGGVGHLSHRSLCFNGADGSLADGRAIDLHCEPGAGRVQLRWETGTEPEAFAIERGADSLHFAELASGPPGRFAGAGAGSYFFADSAAPGAQYYRVRASYRDGASRYSPPTRGEALPDLPGGSEGFAWLSVGPNPFQERVAARFRLGHPQKLRYVLADMSGRSLRSGELDAGGEVQALSLELPGLAAGRYVLTVFHDQGASHQVLIRRP